MEDNLARVQLGTLEVPDGADLAAFLLSDGRMAAKPMPKPGLTLAALLDRFFGSLPEGTLEAFTLLTMRIHRGHLERHFPAILGKHGDVRGLELHHLQDYVTRRSKERGIKGRKLSPATARKEIVTLRSAWLHGVSAQLVAGPFPSRGLRYAKVDEKPPFATLGDIERAIAAGGLAPAQIDDLWDSLFLSHEELKELLELVQVRAKAPYFHPVVAFAAYTGARRSELLRALKSDIDLDAGIATIRERKRVRGQRSTRQVPISPALDAVLRDWLARHPGGPLLFRPDPQLRRVKPRDNVTPDEAHSVWRHTLAGTKFAKVKGFHVLRHSFISCCVIKGVDQRVLDERVGHTQEETRCRYRHLVRSASRSAMANVFAE